MVPSTDSSQIWAFTRLSNGAYKIRNVASNGLLDVQGSGPDDNTNVITHWNDTGGSNQQFFIYFLDNGYYIKPSYTDKVLDMMEIENYNVTIWTKGDYHSPQLFNIKKVEITQLFFLLSQKKIFGYNSRQSCNTYNCMAILLFLWYRNRKKHFYIGMYIPKVLICV